MRRLIVFVAAALTACAQQPLPIVKTAVNPLLQPSPLPYEYPPFDRIQPEHFMPTFEVGMQESLAELEALIAQEGPATFENTIVAMERGGQVDEAEATDRLHRLQALLAEQQRVTQDSMVGRVVNVLFEKHGREAGQMVGKSEYLHAVHADAPEDLKGQIAPVEIIESRTNSLKGRLV